MLPAAAALLLASALSAAGAPLARATRAMVEVTRGQESYRHEQGIAADDAGAIHAHLKRLGESLPEMVRVPGRKRTYLVSEFAAGTGERIGRCLVLLRTTQAGVVEDARTAVVPDAYRLTPVVFAGGGRTIVLAEVAADSSRGLRVYEVAGASVRELGAIDAGVPGELGEGSPMPFAKVRLEGRRVVVRFDADLVIGTGQQGAPIARRPVVFRQQGDGFVRVGGRTRPRR